MATTSDTERRANVENIVKEILNIIGFGSYFPVIKMRLNDIDDETIQKVLNKVAQTVKTW